MAAAAVSIDPSLYHARHSQHAAYSSPYAPHTQQPQPPPHAAFPSLQQHGFPQHFNASAQSSAATTPTSAGASLTPFNSLSLMQSLQSQQQQHHHQQQQQHQQHQHHQHQQQQQHQQAHAHSYRQSPGAGPGAASTASAALFAQQSFPSTGNSAASVLLVLHVRPAARERSAGAGGCGRARVASVVAVVDAVFPFHLPHGRRCTVGGSALGVPQRRVAQPLPVILCSDLRAFSPRAPVLVRLARAHARVVPVHADALPVFLDGAAAPAGAHLPPGGPRGQGRLARAAERAQRGER